MPPAPGDPNIPTSVNPLQSTSQPATTATTATPSTTSPATNLATPPATAPPLPPPPPPPLEAPSVPTPGSHKHSPTQPPAATPTHSGTAHSPPASLATTGRTHRSRGRSRRRRRHRNRRTRDQRTGHHHSPAASTAKASSTRHRRRRSPSTSYSTSSDSRSRSRSHAPSTLRPNQQSTPHHQITNMSQAEFPNIPAIRRPHPPWQPHPPHFHQLSHQEQIEWWLDFHATQLAAENKPQHAYVAKLLADSGYTLNDLAPSDNSPM